jgi:hypothetical protein
VRIRALGNAATATPRSTAFDMESYRTVATEPTETISSPRSYGVAGNATTNDIPAPSSRLSVGEQIHLERIRAERARGFLPSMPDVDFLIEVLERLQSSGTK